MSAGLDATAEALWRLMYGRTSVGYAVVGVRRTNGGAGVVWERHALPVAEPERWIFAVETAIKHELRMELWPYACSSQVLRNIGTSAFRPTQRGGALRTFQSTLTLIWESCIPTDEQAERFAAAGGHLIAGPGDVYGLLPLADARRLAELTVLARDVCKVVGAQPLGFERALPLPGARRAEFLTDISAALTQEPVTSEVLFATGLRIDPLAGLA